MASKKKAKEDNDYDYIPDTNRIKYRICSKCGHKVESGDVIGEYKCASCGYKNKI